MIPDMLFEAWEWLLGLSKVQLVMLGGGVALLVAVSRILRYLFLLVVLLLFLLVLVSEVVTPSGDIALPRALEDMLPPGR